MSHCSKTACSACVQKGMQCHVLMSRTGRDECPSRNTTSIPLPSKAQKILGRGNRKSVSAGNQGEELWTLSPAWSHSSGSWLHKMKLSTVNLAWSWRGHWPYPSRTAAVFSCVLNGEPTKCVVTQKPWLKSLGHKTKRHKYGLQGGVGKQGCSGV